MRNTLDTATRGLETADSIMEPNVLDLLRAFIQCGGQPEEAVRALSRSYQGYAQMCNITAKWLSLSGLPQSEVSGMVEDHIRSVIVQQFNPKLADKVLFESEAPEWLLPLIQTPKWRQLIYTLSKQHTDCQLLNMTIQLISDAGHHSEIASLTSASIYFHVFSRVLQVTLENILNAKNQFELDRLIPDFMVMSVHSQHTYLYCQAILHLLKNETGFGHLGKLSQDLYLQVQHQPLAQNLSRLFTDYQQYPDEVFNALSTVTRAGRVTPNVAEKLYNIYSTQIPPPISLIRRQDIFELLVKELFTPPIGGNVGAPTEYREYYIFLLAYMSCKGNDVDSVTPKEREEINEIVQLLAFLQDACQKHMVGRELQNLYAVLFKSVKFPVVSMCILHWMGAVMKDSSWYLMNINTKSLDIVLDVLNEVTATHPLQHQFVFNILAQSFGIETQLDTLQGLAVKKKMIDSLIYMMECSFVLPVLHEVQQWALAKSDLSLIRYFATKVLQMAGPPFTHEFLSPLLHIIHQLGGHSLANAEYRTVLLPFLRHCHNSDYGLTPFEKTMILELLQKSKS